MHKFYEIVIFTASLSLYADPLLNQIDSQKLISHRLFREHCTSYDENFVKDLSQLGRDLRNVIIVDNSPNAYSFQPENAIPILTWIDDMNDSELEKIGDLLEYMAKTDDVRDIVKAIVHNDCVDYNKVAKILSNTKLACNLECIKKLKQKEEANNRIAKSPIAKYKVIGASNTIKKNKSKKNIEKSVKKLDTQKIKIIEGNQSIRKFGVAKSVRRPKKSNTPVPYSEFESNTCHNSRKNIKSPHYQSSRKHSPAMKVTKKNFMANGSSSRLKIDNTSDRMTSCTNYGNLLQLTTKNRKGRLTSKENYATSNNISPKTRIKPCIFMGSNILNELQESANQGLNQHSNSLDRTDWIACANCSNSGRISLNSDKAKAPLSENIKSGLITSKGLSMIPKSQLETKAELAVRKEKFKPTVFLKKEKFNTLMKRIEGIKASTAKGVQRPIVFPRSNKIGRAHV